MKLKFSCTIAIALVAILSCNELIGLGEASLWETITRPISSMSSGIQSLEEQIFLGRHPFTSVTSRLHNLLIRPQKSDSSKNDDSGSRPMQPEESDEELDPHVSNSRTSGSPNDTSSTDFNSKCFSERGPNFKKPPMLHFYPARSHSPDTLGCATQKTVELNLKPVDGDISDTPELNRTSIQSQIIDTQLFDPEVPTYLIVHGFMNSWKSANWMCRFKDLVLNNSNANVFIVDWSGGAKPLLPIDYGASVSNTQYVGALLGEFINMLIAMTNQTDASNYHMIGHSLGAHICGFAGYYVNTLGRITGLDPAGPCFGSKSDSKQLEASNNGFLGNNKRRLSPDSADFVMALHTDMGLFGLNENCADYDVYVNGGFKQPRCPSHSLTNRIEDIKQLNFKEAFAVDGSSSCAHNYAHKIVETFVNFAPENSESALIVNQDSKTPKLSNFERCFPMAYKCANWDAFKAGECGLCDDSDASCVFTGLSLTQYQAKNLNDVQYNGSVVESNEDDFQYNDEDADLGNDDPDGDKHRLDRFTQGQHFMRLDSQPNGCIFQYQVIVATESNDNGDKNYFYLHLPLELSGRLLDADSKQLHDRLVQVSHKIAPESTAYQLIKSNYMKTLAEMSSSTSFSEQTNVDFYTALITFRQVPQDACKDDSTTNGASRKDYWQLCKPLNSITEARLWASSEQKLDSVLWVGLNYMSGITEELRSKNSYVMTRIDGEQVRAREEVDKADRADLHDTQPKESKSLGNAVENAKGKAGCVLSLFDKRSASDHKKNFKCGRSANELKFAVNLAPQQLA